MEKIELLELSGPNLLVQWGHLVEAAFQAAVRDALLKHKRAGNPIAISRDGKIVILEPHEIEVFEAEPQGFFDRGVQPLRDYPHHCSEQDDHAAHDQMNLAAIQEYAHRVGNQGRNQESQERPTHW